MSLDFAALDHSCNVVRREIEEEFRNLSVIFIPHPAKERRKVLADRRNSILAKPFGRKIYDILSASAVTDSDKTEFMGLIAHDTGLLNLFSKKHYTAIIFINTDDVMLQGNNKHFIYHMAWHALALFQTSVQDAKNQHHEDGALIRRKCSALHLSKNNLMADIFGAILLESQNHKGFIEDLARQRSLDTLSAKPGFIPELYPYPIAYEASRLLYEDIKLITKDRSQILHQALELTQEITFSYDDDTITQWWEFSRPAQEMAWLEHDTAIILGNAIYVSENTNVRALAYQIAELTDITPDSLQNAADYNPFAIDDVNRRHHEAQCEDIFARLVSIAALQNDSHVFSQEEDKQNERLLSGKISGWCAIALEKSAIGFQSARQNEAIQPSELAAEIFYQNLRTIPWAHYKTLAATILKLRRLRAQVTINDLRSALQGKGDLLDIHDYLERKTTPPPQDSVLPRQSAPHPNTVSTAGHGALDNESDTDNYSDEANFIREKLNAIKKPKGTGVNTDTDIKAAPPPIEDTQTKSEADI